MNPLLLYLLGSVAGIALMVGVNLALFGRHERALALDVLEHRLALDHPGFRAGRKVLAGDAALIENAADGALYLARSRGDSFVTRRLARGSVRRMTRQGAALELRLADYTFPKAHFAFADVEEAGAWEALLAGV